MHNNTVIIFGGTGFIGRSLTPLLLKSYSKIFIPTRSTTTSHLPFSTETQVTYLSYTPEDALWPEDLLGILAEADVVNLVGILYPWKTQTFEHVHIHFVKSITELCKQYNARRLIHLSAIGADPKSPSQYARSKAQGEQYILKKFQSSTILRPSVVFGKEDAFINRFNDMARFSPFLPTFGGGKNTMQPVYVEDVAKAIIACLNASPDKAEGQIFELGGPKTYTFKEILAFILEASGKKRILLPLPYALGKLIGTIGDRFMPSLLTSDQIILLQIDNVVSSEAKGFQDLNIVPSSMQDIVPDYLHS